MPTRSASKSKPPAASVNADAIVERVRQMILGASPEVVEEVKWNSPSFRTTEHFATFNLRAKDQVRLILHTGAKSKVPAPRQEEIPDPKGLLQWLGPDRCVVTFRSEDDVVANQGALVKILRAWVKQMREPARG